LSLIDKKGKALQVYDLKHVTNRRYKYKFLNKTSAAQKTMPDVKKILFNITINKHDKK